MEALKDLFVFLSIFETIFLIDDSIGN